jgi:cytochrome b involved in lipid metabolism
MRRHHSLINDLSEPSRERAQQVRRRRRESLGLPVRLTNSKRFGMATHACYLRYQCIPLVSQVVFGCTCLQHNSEADCWIAIGADGEEKVYDVTKYLSDHPGGGEIILEFAGEWRWMVVIAVATVGICCRSLSG